MRGSCAARVPREPQRDASRRDLLSEEVDPQGFCTGHQGFCSRSIRSRENSETTNQQTSSFWDHARTHGQAGQGQLSCTRAWLCYILALRNRGTLGARIFLLQRECSGLLVLDVGDHSSKVEATVETICNQMGWLGRAIFIM